MKELGKVSVVRRCYLMICKDLGNSRLTRDMVSANGCKVL